MLKLEQLINEAFEERQQFSPDKAPEDLLKAVLEIIDKLNSGKWRIAEKINGVWVTHQWLKKAILLSFRLFDNEVIEAGFTNFFDKVPLKYEEYSSTEFTKEKVRVVPGAIVRMGAHIAANTVLMPSFVNIGAFVDSGCMVDTWATVGSCAQIGKNVHLSGGVGIGGVLEPLQANPTIIEDNCFIGARSEVVEGVIVESGAVLSMGVFISQSTRIYNRLTGEISYGRVPANAVVVPGSLPAKDSSHSLACAIIVKFIDEKTRAKIQLNDLLREAISEA